MKFTRTITVAGLMLFAVAGFGCSQQAAVLPTDQAAKDLAKQAAPPIVGMSGGPGGNAANKNTAQPGGGNAKAPAGRGAGKLHGVNQ